MQTSFSELEYASKKKLTRRDRFLAELEAITPWTALEQTIAPFYPSSGSPGRQPLGLVRMLRMYVAQQCFGYSDEGMEDAIYDSQAIRRFIALFAPFVLAQAFTPIGILGSLIGLLAFGWLIYLLYTTAKSPTKQGFHDVFANTMVVKATRSVA